MMVSSWLLVQCCSTAVGEKNGSIRLSNSEAENNPGKLRLDQPKHYHGSQAFKTTFKTPISCCNKSHALADSVPILAFLHPTNATNHRNDGKKFRV
jgi:hypothetical protein